MKEQKKKNWPDYIHKRIEANKNFLCFISGPTGSGKSYSSLSIAEDLDPSFNIKRVVFNGLELMELINNNSLSKGSVIVFEEVGVEMNNRNWQSQTNKMLNFLMQTFRHRNLILIMNSPYMDFVDASTRKLFHAELSTVHINKAKKTVKLKPQLIQYNPRLQKFYYKYLKYRDQDGRITKVVGWNVGLPSKRLIKAYEERKREYTDNLNQDIMNGFKQMKAEEQRKSTGLSEVQAETLHLLLQGRTISDIATERNKSKTSIYKTIEILKTKGYDIQPVRGIKGGVERYEVKE